MPITHSYVYSICGWVAHFLSNKEFLSFPMCESQIERNQQPQFIQWVYKSFFSFFSIFFRFSSRMSFVWCINYSVKMAFKMDQWRMKYTDKRRVKSQYQKSYRFYGHKSLIEREKGMKWFESGKPEVDRFLILNRFFLCVVCIKNHFDLSLQPPSFWVLLSL